MYKTFVCLGIITRLFRPKGPKCHPNVSDRLLIELWCNTMHQHIAQICAGANFTKQFFFLPGPVLGVRRT